MNVAINSLKAMKNLAGYYVLRAEGALLEDANAGYFGVVPALLGRHQSAMLAHQLRSCGVIAEIVPAREAVKDMIRKLSAVSQ